MITLKPTTWWFVAAAVALLLFIVLIVGYSEPLQTLLLRETVAPQLERDFGFTAAHVKVGPDSLGSDFIITSVTPGGAFERAGVVAGDQPWDYHGRSELGLYYALQSARDRTVSMRFVRLAPTAHFPKLVTISIGPKLPVRNSELE